MVTSLNSDLADTLGNLVQRVTAKKLHAGLKGDISLALLRCENGPVSSAEDLLLLKKLRNISGALHTCAFMVYNCACVFECCINV